MLANLVKVAVPTPGTVDVGTVVALGAADAGFVTFHTAFGVGAQAYFALSDGAGRTLFGIWTTGTGTGGAPVATVQQILWNARTNSAAAESFADACVAWNALPAQRTADKAYADAAPASRISTDKGYWSGNFDLISAQETNFVSLSVPEGTRHILFSGAARAVNTSATVADYIVRVALNNAANANLDEMDVAGIGTSGNGSYASTGIGGSFGVGYALPAGCSLVFTARKGANVGPYNLQNLRAAALFVR